MVGGGFACVVMMKTRRRWWGFNTPWRGEEKREV